MSSSSCSAPHRHPPPFPTRRSSDLACAADSLHPVTAAPAAGLWVGGQPTGVRVAAMVGPASADGDRARITRRVETLEDRKSTRLNSSHLVISYAVFCLKKKTTKKTK